MQLVSHTHAVYRKFDPRRSDKTRNECPVAFAAWVRATQDVYGTGLDDAVTTLLAARQAHPPPSGVY